MFRAVNLLFTAFPHSRRKAPWGTNIMMHHVRRLFRDERGTSFEKIALSVAIMAVCFIATADVLDFMSRKHGVAIGVAARNVARAILPSAGDDGIDYSTTGSIRPSQRQEVVLDPCTGQQK